MVSISLGLGLCGPSFAAYDAGSAAPVISAATSSDAEKTEQNTDGEEAADTAASPSDALYDEEGFLLDGEVSSDQPKNNADETNLLDQELLQADANSGKTDLKALKAENNIIPVNEIILDKSNVTAIIGDVFTLTVVVLPEDATDREVSWFSSDETVALIDQNGTVTAVNTGETTITAAAADGETAAYCEVRVVDESEVFYWGIDGNGELRISTGKLPAKYTGGIYSEGNSPYEPIPWLENKDLIKAVVIGGSGSDILKPTRTSAWFQQCSNLKTVDLTYLDTALVEDMNCMFEGCSALQKIDLSDHDLSTVKDMRCMFTGCASLKSISFKDVNADHLTDIYYIVGECTGLEKIDFSYFSAPLLTEFDPGFRSCTGLKEADLSHMNLESVESFEELFRYAPELLSVNMQGMNTSALKSVKYMFDSCAKLKSVDFSNMSMGKVEDMSSLFYGCGLLEDVDFTGADTSSVISMNSAFSGCRSLKKIDVAPFDTGSVKDMGGMFCYCTSLSDIDVSGFDTSNVENMSEMFTSCTNLKSPDLRRFNTERVLDFSRMFLGCIKFQSLDISSFKTHQAKYMNGMFSGCTGLKNLDVTHFDTRNVLDMAGMFSECSALEKLDVSHFHTEKVTDMCMMFRGCENLKEINVSGFNTSQVQSMREMFRSCNSLLKLDVSGFDTHNVQGDGMYAMFGGCWKLDSLDLSGFDTSKVTMMDEMFWNCISFSVLDLSSFDTRNVESMIQMFWLCQYELKTIKVGPLWNTDKVTRSDDMFAGDYSLTGGAGTRYDSRHLDKEYARIDRGAATPGYFTEGHVINKEKAENFIRRLYRTALGREADSGGLSYWMTQLRTKKIKGIELAGSFIFSKEFTSKNYCNEHFVAQIYPALMGRGPDTGGLAFWAGKLDGGMTREAMLNNFTASNEYKELCSDAGIELGAPIKVPEYGVQPYGPCAVCGKKTKVVQFAERMYTVCLDRAAETGGLAYWSKGLYEQTITGKSILEFFFLSKEIKGKNLTNREYVRRIYKAMLDRDPDSSGWNYWEGRLNSGSSPTAVIAGFIDSKEFTGICNDYGIKRK